MHIIGIDVSKQKLHSGWLVDAERGKLHTKTTANTPAGHQALLKWAQQHTQAGCEELHFILEATGVYHEAVAEFLYEAGARVSVVNPLRVKRFAESHGIRTKTDAHDRLVLARFGRERRPAPWVPPAPEAKQLKALVARLDALQTDIQRELNRLEKAQIRDTPDVVDSIETMLQALRQEQRRLMAHIDDHIDRHPQLKRDRQLLASIPAIGDKLSARLLSLFHTQSFVSAPQAAAYLGLSVIQYQSGTSVHKRPRLAKQGDPRMRAALYMPALSAIQHNPDIRALYQRLLANNKSPMSAVGAAMRKLVHIAFGVIKHQTPYEPQTT